jgi:cobyrinic acid a,c-diamide synthase
MRLAKAFVVAAPASGSGKTMVTLALLRQFRNRGLRVASAKVGPDYIDPRFHEAASGRPCMNLDPWAMGADLCKSIFHSLAQNTDVIVIEGVMGLFDGPTGGSTADLAAMLGLPVVLVVDASHQAQSVAALIHGFSTYRKDIEIAGIILNRVASSRHDALLRAALEKSPSIFASIGRASSLDWPSRHLGLVQAVENQQLATFIESAASHVPAFDLGAMPDFEVIATGAIKLSPPGQCIAIAQDQAFSFTYPHVVAGWKAAGANILPFSPLKDEAPAANADFIILPGGYPELHAGQLAAGSNFLNGLRTATCQIYGECGGYMVLGDALIDERGHAHKMAGLLPLATSFADRKLHLGYRDLKPLAGPWTRPLRGHEFHYSTIMEEGRAERLFEARDSAGAELPAMGLKRGHVMGSFAHVISERAA